MKLKEPVSSLLSTLAATTSGNFYIVPKEAESQIDLRRDQVGSGPYYRAEYVPSSRFVYKRNPGYYDKERPYVDEVEIPIVTEYSAGLAQFRSGGVYTYPVRPEEVVGLKRELPQLQMYEADFATPNIVAFFGWRPSSPEKTPFRDVRVRQAYSMAWDRDLFIDITYDVPNYKAQGLPIETRWNSAVIVTAYKGWRMDPRDKEFGPNGKFFQHDIAEAKKLLAAAGYANGLNVVSNHITTPNYGADWVKQVEVLEGMASEAGFKFTLNPVNFNTNWVPEFREAKGNFEGLSYRGVPAEPDVTSRLYAEYSKLGGRFTGFDPDGKGTYAGDPACEDLLTKMRVEFDDAKRKELVKEMQRYLGKMQYYIRSPGGASGLSLAWPTLQNFQVYRGDGRPNYYYWLDDAQAPLRKS
jgi:ABC-type transport system substrate-binding protein